MTSAGVPVQWQASRRALATGWVLYCSARAARRRRVSRSMPGAGSMEAMEKVPSVRVPVLSKTMVRTLLRASK